MRGEVGKKTPKKEMDNPSFLWCHIGDFWDTLSSYKLISKLNFFFSRGDIGSNIERSSTREELPTRTYAAEPVIANRRFYSRNGFNVP